MSIKSFFYSSLFIITSSFLFITCKQPGEFTDKADARNQMVNGLKEGKWVEYFNSIGDTDTRNMDSPFYQLTVYNNNIPTGNVRMYYKSGNILSITPYVNGKKNGVEKWYFESGGLDRETPNVNGVCNGVWKEYYESGKLASETPYTNGKRNGTSKEYDENGKIMREILFTNGIKGETKLYDENGNEIKN